MEINSALRFKSFENKPDVRVGQSGLEGEENKWDKLASNRTHVDPQPARSFDSSACLVPSGLTRWVVTEIYEAYEPKKGSRIRSWETRKDYSEHPDFEKVWKVEVKDYELWYNLADILLGICGLEV